MKKTRYKAFYLLTLPTKVLYISSVPWWSQWINIRRWYLVNDRFSVSPPLVEFVYRSVVLNSELWLIRNNLPIEIMTISINFLFGRSNSNITFLSKLTKNGTAKSYCNSQNVIKGHFCTRCIVKYFFKIEEFNF